MNKTRRRRTTLPLVALLLSVAGLIPWTGMAALAVAQAQDEVLTVTVVEVDDTAFPQVAVRLAVQTANGLPATGLTVDNVQLSEEGARVPASAISLDGDTTQPVGLALAIDVSVEEDSFPLMQAAVRNLVGSLGERDQVAVIAFADEVRLVQDFAGRDQAASAIDGLVAGGNYTVLNEATVQAATKASEAPLVRKAAVIVTDSPSNLGSALQETVDALDQIGVPVHLVGFGTKIAADKAEEMKTLAQSTAGQAFVLPAVSEIGGPLQTLNVLLHQGYKLSYRSDLAADRAEHTLSIGVDYLGSEARAEARFVASPGQVTVRMPGLEEGMALGGLVHLTALATAPAPIVSVEYLLDGATLASLSEPPYGYDWDAATADAGEHTLAARATDSAGNQGTAEVKVTVGPPVVAALSVAQAQVKPGEAVSAEAQVTSIAELAYVEFLVDGRPAETADAPPYRITVDTAGYAPGVHTITARAVDRLGRTSEARFDVQVLAPPTPTPAPTPTPVPLTRVAYEQAWPIGAVIAIVLAAGVLTGLVVSAQRKRRRMVLQLTVHNAGNVGDSYELWSEAPRAVRVQFARNGIPLTRREITLTEQLPEAATPGALPGAAGRMGGIGEKARGLAGLASSITYGLSSILRFLPASARSPAQRGMGQLQRGQSRLQSASISASRLSRTADRLAPAGQGAASGAGGESARTSQEIRTITLSGYQTPFVDPDERSALDVLVDPTRQHYRSKDYLIKVFSRSIEQPGAPTVVAQESVQVQGVSLFRRVFPFLLVYGFAILGLFLLKWVLTAGL